MSGIDLTQLELLRAKKRKIDDEIAEITQAFPQVGDLVICRRGVMMVPHIVLEVHGEAGSDNTRYGVTMFMTHDVPDMTVRLAKIRISPHNELFRKMKDKERELEKVISDTVNECEAVQAILCDLCSTKKKH